jgi:hypothetical protein
MLSRAIKNFFIIKAKEAIAPKAKEAIASKAKEMIVPKRKASPKFVLWG